MLILSDQQDLCINGYAKDTGSDGSSYDKAHQRSLQLKKPIELSSTFSKAVSGVAKWTTTLPSPGTPRTFSAKSEGTYDSKFANNLLTVNGELLAEMTSSPGGPQVSSFAEAIAKLTIVFRLQAKTKCAITFLQTFGPLPPFREPPTPISLTTARKKLIAPADITRNTTQQSYDKTIILTKGDYTFGFISQVATNGDAGLGNTATASFQLKVRFTPA